MIAFRRATAADVDWLCALYEDGEVEPFLGGGRARDRAAVADEGARLLQRYLLLELGYHRLELACYGFNDAAIRHAERVGFVREGVKRKAYLRHGEWQDAVLYSLLRDDLAD